MKTDDMTILPRPVIDNEVPTPVERAGLWETMATVLRRNPAATRRFRELARRVLLLTERVDRFIQDQTAAVCPDCTSVCCINRHAFHDRADLLFLAALGRQMPVYDDGCVLTDPCQFLGARGCTVPRGLRPYRCNWYFCDALLRHMEDNASPAHRTFSAEFQKLIDTRRRLVECFERLAGKHLNESADAVDRDEPPC